MLSDASPRFVRTRGVVVLVPLLAVSGCVAPWTLEAQPVAGLEPAEPRVVVALIDTGINPWHAAFGLRPQQEAMIPPVPAEVVPATFRDRLAEEGPGAWDSLERGRLYWFEGTRVLAISLTARLPEEYEALFPQDPRPVYDDVNHGTGTASVVAATSPHSWFVMVETNELPLDGYRWAADQQWLDVVTSSRGTLGHTPDNYTNPDEFARAWLRTVEAGKVAVNSGGNFPDPNLLSGRESPPWVISVGGAEGDRHGVSPLTSQPVDVVANLTWNNLAWNRSDDETYVGKGTSFGAPHVAGVLAEAIYQLRAATGHLGGIADGALVNASGVRVTNADLRWALNMTARYWDTSEYEVRANVSQFPTFVAYEVTNPALPRVAPAPVGPWLQMGWGYVDGSVTQDIVDLLLGRAVPPEKADAAMYMEGLYAVRQAVWDVRQGS